MALLAGSLAINAGNNANAPATDQRGYFRVSTSDIGAYEFNGTVPPAVSLVSTRSRKTHNGVGAFDVKLPGVECRSGGATGDHMVIFTFTNPLSSVGAVGVTSGTGLVSTSGIGSDAHDYAVNLTGVANAQQITITLNIVTDSLGNYSNAVSASMGVLFGDSNGDGTVNSGDAFQTRSRSGQPVSATNFRSDYNVDGTINSGDAFIVRSRSGQFIP
jgi:hypothetical protein